MPRRLRIIMVAALAIAAALRGLAEPARGNVGVDVLSAVKWSPDDPVREGAGEFEVLLRVAQLQRAHPTAGLVSIGDRHGTRAGGGESALARAALSGVAVVKLAPHGGVVASPDGVFLDGGALPVEKAQRILTYCLETYGAPPRAKNISRPTPAELAAIRAHLQPFQAALAAATIAREA